MSDRQRPKQGWGGGRASPAEGMASSRAEGPDVGSDVAQLGQMEGGVSSEK